MTDQIHLDDYLAIAERVPSRVGKLVFQTGITERRLVEPLVVDCLREIEVSPKRIDWGENGLVVKFKSQHELILFSLAFRGPRKN